MYIKLDLSYPRNKKTRRFAALLGEGPGGRWWPVALWLHAAEQGSDGDFAGVSDQEIAEFAGYTGDAATFVRLLKECGFIDPATNRIHDWDEHNGFHKNLKQRARTAGLASWEARKNRTSSSTSRSATSEQQAEPHVEHDPNKLLNGKSEEMKEERTKEETEEEKRGEERIGVQPQVQHQVGEEESDPNFYETRIPTVLPIPTLEEVRQFSLNSTNLGPVEEAEKFWRHYESQGWMVNGQRITNWQAKLPNWIADARAREYRNKQKGSYPQEKPRKSIEEQNYDALMRRPISKTGTPDPTV